MTKIAIILTCCVERKTPQETKVMRHIYTRNINSWLDKYPYDVYVADGSNNTFEVEHERLKQVPVVQNTYLVNPKEFSSSTAESNLVLSTLAAYDFAEYDKIFKITGRYFIDNFEPPEQHALFYTQQPKHGFHHSEVIGFSDHALMSMFYHAVISSERICEKQVREIAHLSIELAPMRNTHNTPRGGDRFVVNPL